MSCIQIGKFEFGTRDRGIGIPTCLVCVSPTRTVARVTLSPMSLSLTASAATRSQRNKGYPVDRALGRQSVDERIILPHPRSPGGKPQRLTARVKIASAPVFPTASFCRRGQFPICLSVCPSVCPARATSQIWEQKRCSLLLRTRQPKFLHRPKRLRCDSGPCWRCYATNRAADARPGRPQAHRRTP